MRKSTAPAKSSKDPIYTTSAKWHIETYQDYGNIWLWSMQCVEYTSSDSLKLERLTQLSYIRHSACAMLEQGALWWARQRTGRTHKAHPPDHTPVSSWLRAANPSSRPHSSSSRSRQTPIIDTISLSLPTSNFTTYFPHIKPPYPSPLCHYHAPGSTDNKPK